MPRKARIDAPGALHHIIIRGIERSPIFKDSSDYASFIERLGDLIIETGTSCYAWALMSNHVHLLLRTGFKPIPTLMRQLLTWYAQYFNRRHQRYGHLFQNRYRSFLCEEDPYLLELVRYIHLNPIRAGIVKDISQLHRYALTGHAVIMGRILHEWQDVKYVLRMFGKSSGPARKAYRKFVSAGVAKGSRPDLVGGGLLRSVGGWMALKKNRKGENRLVSDERILGSSGFVESVLEQANETYEKRTLALAKGIYLDKLLELAAEHFDTEEDVIKSSLKLRSAARARAVACFLARDRLGLSGAEIARKMNLTPSAVSKLAGRGRKDPMAASIESRLFDDRY